VRAFRVVCAGLGAFACACVAAWTFAAAVNLYYAFHPWYFAGTAVAFVVASLLGAAAGRACGLPPTRARWIAQTLVAAWIGAVFLVAWWEFPKPADAARVNRAVLRSVPVHPSLRFVDEVTVGTLAHDEDFTEGFVNPPRQWLTTWRYDAPRHADTAGIARWYAARLRAGGWRVARDDVGFGIVILVADRRGREIEVDVRPDTAGAGLPPGAPPRVDVSAAAG